MFADNSVVVDCLYLPRRCQWNTVSRRNQFGSSANCRIGLSGHQRQNYFRQAYFFGGKHCRRRQQFARHRHHLRNAESVERPLCRNRSRIQCGGLVEELGGAKLPSVCVCVLFVQVGMDSPHVPESRGKEYNSARHRKGLDNLKVSRHKFARPAQPVHRRSYRGECRGVMGIAIQGVHEYL